MLLVPLTSRRISSCMRMTMSSATVGRAGRYISVLTSPSNDSGSAIKTCSTTSASETAWPTHASSLISSFRCWRNSVIEVPSSIFRFVSFLLNNNLREFVLLSRTYIRNF
ncbi:hypothetical protein KC19_1G274100 [Ceratodon purpureus]|uniref:Uncharacterized protein n=1 Tax=Ceratodon purpureus TaxID=3225 RepID=A0A8T0J9W0_CERPU|nr:hypothetical protein KC19_1G274100 [Ceratodon purpureus]